MNGKELGLEFGSLRDYVWAILYPLSICLVIIIIALVTGNIVETKYSNEMTGKIVYLFVYTLIMAFTTEEGFFRGWLFGILERDKMNPKLILLLTALAFASWHLPLFLFDPSLTLNMIPIYIYWWDNWRDILWTFKVHFRFNNCIILLPCPLEYPSL
jgi:membrane protease YdiL (CAAX protease family)